MVERYNSGAKLEAEHQARLLTEEYPASGTAWKVLGALLQSSGKDAIHALQRAAELLPDDAEANNNLGVALHQCGNSKQGIEYLNRSISIDPNFAKAYFNLGNALQNSGDINEAVNCYRKGLRIAPDVVGHTSLLFCLSHNRDIDAQTLFAEHLRFAKEHETPLRPHWTTHQNSKIFDRPLQIGIVSGDLFHHAIASFIEPLLTHLSKRADLSLHAYANHAVDDNVSQRLKTYFVHWTPVSGLPDEALAKKIREDGIDILIDLSGHTDKNRLLTFARKPAPIQASWMGYPGTTGLAAMDYYLADRFFIPEGQFDDQFTEKLVRMPGSAPFLPYQGAPEVNALPAHTNGYITFGSFNRLNKISRAVIALWAKILRASPDSHMILGGIEHFETPLKWFAEEGIAQNRLSFYGRIDMGQYMALHHQVDVCLDTFPYNGGTTTLHALWMGIPTLTLAGKTAAGRPGACIMGHVGLDDFIAYDADEFVQKGVSLATNLQALSNIRNTLRDRFNASAMGQPELIAKGVEQALRIMWKNWCTGLPAKPFEVTLKSDEIEEKNAPDSLSPEILTKAIRQAMQLAVAEHQAGRLQKATELYESILQINPEEPDANHNMGILTLQNESAEAALPYLLRALDADPARGQYWLSYIDALIVCRKIEEAGQILELARQQGLQGEEVEQLNNRLIMESKPTDLSSEANGVHKKKTSKKPLEPVGKKPRSRDIDNLVQQYSAGKYAEALSIARSMSNNFPYFGFGWMLLGAILKKIGQDEEAIFPMQQAAKFMPNDMQAHSNLGLTLQHAARLEEAEASFRRALQIAPKNAEIHNDLGNTLKDMGRLEEAEDCYRRALKIRPDYAEGYNNLGVTLQHLERFEEARDCYQRALRLNPEYVKAQNNLGIAFMSMGNADQAIACYLSTLNLQQDFAEAHNNLGLALQSKSQLIEATASFRQALKLNPNYYTSHTNMLFCLAHSDIEPDALFKEHLKFAAQFEMPLRKYWRTHTNSKNPERRLQIGIVSGDLCSHSIATFIEPLLKSLSATTGLTLHAYANHAVNAQTPSNIQAGKSTQAHASHFANMLVSLRLQGYFAHWHPVFRLSDEALAKKIREDGIDILIDLSGHTDKNRLLTFARKPAPIQASWMGYPGTTGLAAMDYYLADRFFIPEGQFDDQFTEKLVRMPGSAPFLPYQGAPEVNALPAHTNGYITFGSFNRLNKISRAVIALWAKILRASPDSHMILGGIEHFETPLKWFAEEGIAQNRLSFYGRIDMGQYMALHHQVDVCLDTFPYNGGTTTLHALWMGIPTLTLAGKTAAGRPGACIMGHVGLDDFIAYDADEFVQKGVSLATNLQALSNIRNTLRDRFNASAMGQPELIAKGVEQALRIMWKNWCEGRPPASFEVSREEITRQEVK